MFDRALPNSLYSRYEVPSGSLWHNKAELTCPVSNEVSSRARSVVSPSIPFVFYELLYPAAGRGPTMHCTDNFLMIRIKVPW